MQRIMVILTGNQTGKTYFEGIVIPVLEMLYFVSTWLLRGCPIVGEMALQQFNYFAR